MLPDGLVSIKVPGGKGRKHIIGGSDWQHIISPADPDIYKYGCIRQLWYAKQGIKPDFPEKQRKITARGKLMEPIVRKIFQRSLGCKFSRIRPWAKELWPGQPIPEWMVTKKGGRAHVDDLYYFESELELEVAEYKTMNSHVWYPYLEDGLSPGYKLQPQHYMAIHGLDMSTLGVCWPDGIDFMAEPVPRDEETIRLMFEAGEWFMKDVVGSKNPPDRLPLTEQRCGECKYRTKCLGRGYYEEHVLKEFAFDEDKDLYLLMQKHHEAHEREKEGKNEKETIAQEIKDYLGKNYKQDPEKIHCREIEGIYKKSLQSKFQKKDAMAESIEAAELIRKHTKVSPIRSFSSKVTKKSIARWEGIQNSRLG